MRKKYLIALTIAALLFCKAEAQNTFPTGAGTFAGIGTTSPAAPLSIKLTTQAANPPAFIQYLNELNDVLYEQRFQMGTVSGAAGGPGASMYFGTNAGKFADIAGGANYNTIIGSYAAGNLTTAGYNTALGIRVLRDVTTGSFNTAVGERAMQKLTTGEDNIAIGEVALAAITTASRNIAIGTGTMATNASGDNNTVIGAYAGKIGTYSGSVILGYRAASLTDPGSNKLWIQNSNAAIPLIYGDFSTGKLGLGTINPTEKLSVVGNTTISGQLSVGNATNFQLSGDHNASIYRGLNVITQSSKKTVYMYSDESYQLIDAYDYANLVPLPLRISYSGGNTIIGNENYGRTGIGTSTPTEKLDVAGNIYTNGKILINQANTPAVTAYALAVNGSAIFTKAVVKLNANWPDYVFSKNYELPTLKSIENYINENNHLPGVASAAEVEKTGIDLGDNQAVLLKKVEELTLYMIELNKKVEALTKENEEIKAKLKN